jgi:hypothetical protein
MPILFFDRLQNTFREEARGGYLRIGNDTYRDEMKTGQIQPDIGSSRILP